MSGGALSTLALFTATVLRMGGSWHTGVALTCATQSEPRGDQQVTAVTGIGGAGTLRSGCSRLKQGHGTHHSACPRSVSGPEMPMGKCPPPPAGAQPVPSHLCKGHRCSLECLPGAASAAVENPETNPCWHPQWSPQSLGCHRGRAGGHSSAHLAPQVSTVSEAPSPTSSPTSMGRDGLGVAPFWANQDPSNLALAEVTAPQCLWQ